MQYKNARKYANNAESYTLIVSSIICWGCAFVASTVSCRKTFWKVLVFIKTTRRYRCGQRMN